jgi:hypothetical protein
MILRPLERGNSDLDALERRLNTSAARDCKVAPAVLPGGGAGPI